MVTLIFLRLCWRAPLMMISFMLRAVQNDSGI
jgi:hypothetical protein